MAKSAVKEKKSKKRPVREAYCFKCQESHVLGEYEIVRLKSGRKQVIGKPKKCPNGTEKLYGFVGSDVPHDRDQTDEEANTAKKKREAKKESFIGKTKKDEAKSKKKKSKDDDEDEDEKPKKKSKKSKEEKSEKTKKKSKKDKAEKSEKKSKKKSKK